MMTRIMIIVFYIMLTTLSIIGKNYRFFEYKSHNYVIKSQNLLRESFGH